MTLQDMMVELSEGNPGALSVLIQMVQAAEAQDMISALPFLFAYMAENGLTGSEIWVLYKDECGEEFDVFLQTLFVRTELSAITQEAVDADV